MSRLRLPAFLTTPLRPALGRAAETRPAKICAKRSTKASNGCEERLAIWPITRRAAGSASYIRSQVAQIILLMVIPKSQLPLQPLVVSPDLGLQHLFLLLLVPLRGAHLQRRIDGHGQVAVTEPPCVERRVREVVGAVRVLLAFRGALVPDQPRVLVHEPRAKQRVQLDPRLDEPVN